MTAPISKQSWDEDAFYEHAAMHRSVAELHLLRHLVNHASATDGRIIWRRGGLPGASVWYHVGGELSAVYGFSAGDASTPAHVLLYLGDLPVLLPPDHLARVRAALHNADPDPECWTTRLLPFADLSFSPKSVESLFRLIATITDH